VPLSAGISVIEVPPSAAGSRDPEPTNSALPFAALSFAALPFAVLPFAALPFGALRFVAVAFAPPSPPVVGLRVGPSVALSSPLAFRVSFPPP